MDCYVGLAVFTGEDVEKNEHAPDSCPIGRILGSGCGVRNRETSEPKHGGAQMHARPTQSRVIKQLRFLWHKFTSLLPEYDRRNKQEWLYWGTRRAERSM